VHFGPRGHLFGWWEHPARAPRACIVISDSVAYESMCSHWAFRRLSSQLVGLGFAVLRVDMLGTGDSADVPPDESLVSQWKWSLNQAADAARAWTHGAPLALLGLRISGTLCAQVASERDDVTALALLDPAPQGRLWLREQKALALTSGLGIGKPSVEELADGGQAILGYQYTPLTQAELSQLKLTAIKRKPAKVTFVLQRPGRALDGAALDALGREGLTVAESEQGGLDTLLKDGVFSEEPVFDFARLGSWLDENFPAALEAPSPASKTAAHHEGEGYTEEAVLIGGSRQIAAIFCTPSRTPRRAATLLILNTGVNHRVGAHRTSVELARNMARDGYPSLRIDVSGVGDSPLQPGQKQNFPYNRGNVDDIRASLDWLASRGLGGFVLTGICSGGFNSFHAAQADERIKALVLTNTQRFIWRDGDSIEISMRRGLKSTQHYQSAALKLDTWKRLAAGDIDVKVVLPGLAKRFAKQGARRLEAGLSRTLGPRFARDPVARGFLKLNQRGVKLTFVLSADDGARDELDDHLGKNLAALRGKSGVTVEILEGADHTLTPRFARARLFEVIKERLVEVSG
jgi:dienelactone hydrolase